MFAETLHQPQHSDWLLSILLRGIVSANSKLRGGCAELLLYRLVYIPSPNLDRASLLSRMELEMKTTQSNEIKFEILRLCTCLLKDVSWFGAIMQSSTLLEYASMDIVKVTHTQLSASSQLTGFECLKNLLLAQDDFISQLFICARAYWVGARSQQDMHSSINLNHQSGCSGPCPMDELRTYILHEWVEADLGDAEASQGDEKLLVSSLKTICEICRSVCAPCTVCRMAESRPSNARGAYNEVRQQGIDETECNSQSASSRP